MESNSLGNTQELKFSCPSCGAQVDLGTSQLPKSTSLRQQIMSHTIKHKESHKAPSHTGELNRSASGFQSTQGQVALMKQQIEELRAEIDSKSEKYDNMKELLNKSDLEVSEIKQKIRQKDNELAERTLQIDQLREDLDAKEHEIFDAKQRLRNAQEVFEKSSIEQEKKLEQMKLLKENLENLKVSVTQKDADLHELNAKLKATQ